MDIALFLLILGSIAAGVTGAVLSSWALRSKVLSLESDVAELQTRLVRETKARAGEMGRTKKDLVQEAMALVQRERAAVGSEPYPWQP